MADQLSASCWYFSQSILHWFYQSEAATLQNTLSLLFPLSIQTSNVVSAVEEVVWAAGALTSPKTVTERI
jgi:hypothetical protein